jgi:A/G-specific adenine glycosylase
MGPDLDSLRTELLAWYDRQARILPWRVSPADRAAGVRPDPYRVWLSEIMLQQTTVAAVGPYFARFLAAFPTVQALAAAPSEQVMQLWAGLGYYARARNLHACARRVAELGGFPSTVEGLQQLPGVGPYTAAAIAAIAFDQPVTPADGNVERVLARLWRIEAQLPAGKAAFRQAASRFDGGARPGDFIQALMDLGATLCTPKAPACALCPWMEPCAARRAGDASEFPRKAPKKDKPVRHGMVFALEDRGRLLVRRRPERGLLGGMLELPGTPWRTGEDGGAWPLPEAASDHAPLEGPGWRLRGTVSHVFTHFRLELEVAHGQARLERGAQTVPLDALDDAGLPTVMLKAARLAMSGRLR